MNNFQSQKQIWENYWAKSNDAQTGHKVVLDILNSRFTSKAYVVLKKFMSSEDKNILEAGCGTGRFCCLLAKDFPASKITGIDISRSALKIARSMQQLLEVENVYFGEGNIFSIDFPDNSFDVVFNEGVIEHYELSSAQSYISALEEMIKVTRPGGKIIVAVPNWYNLIHTFYKWSLKHLEKNYEYGYEKSFKHRELRELYEKHGLRDIEMAGFYPAYGFYRLDKYSILFSIMAKLIDIIGNRHINYKYGFEIVIKGVK